MDELIQTPYGEMCAERLEQLQSCFDTRQLLKAGDVLDQRCAVWKKELRDDLLAVHGMAHTVINGAALARARVPGTESLPEAAYSLAEDFREWREALDKVLGLLDQLAALEPD